ncbi:hypothetical protein B0H14DRAFT_2577096 [Mycena olivaceomarginata]|nr:hypothetical protein B0H14DRAFT_2577096 [Mycena olivaceomarginata]
MECGYKVNGSVRDYAKGTTVYGVPTSRLSALPRQLVWEFWTPFRVRHVFLTVGRQKQETAQNDSALASAGTKQTTKKSTGGANPRAQLIKKQALATKGPAYSTTKGPVYSIAWAYNVAAGARVIKNAPAPRVLLGARLPVLMSAGVLSSTMPFQFPGFIVSAIPTELDLGGTGFHMHRIMSLKADENFGDTVPNPVPFSSVFMSNSLGFQNCGDGQIIHLTRGLSAQSTRICPSPKSVLLLVYALEEFPLATTSIPGLVHFLNMLLPLNFASLQVNFDLSTDEGSKLLELANEAIAESLMNGALQSIQKILVIIVSHTTPDFGDIHIAPNYKASSPGNDVLASGPTRLNPDSHTINSNTFYGLIAFAAQKFQLAATSHFLQVIIREFFIHGQENLILDCLGHSAGLGSHSGVIYLCGDNKNHREYLWAHPVRAPFGVPHALSCLCGIVSTFKRLPPWGAGKSQDLCAPVISLRCRCCDWVEEFIKPEEFTFTRKFADNDFPEHRKGVYCQGS